jgi:hypothetical protein
MAGGRSLWIVVMAKPKKLPEQLQVWLDARQRYRLTHTQVQMARELGLNPKKFGSLSNHRQEPWKMPLPDYIEHLYYKRFGKRANAKSRSARRANRNAPKQRLSRNPATQQRQLWSNTMMKSHFDMAESDRRIQALLAGVDADEQLDAWEEYLDEHLSFPFEAEVHEHQERGPVRQGERVKVKSIYEADDFYGLIVEVRRGREKFWFPLCDLEVTDHLSQNYQPVKDYAIWFANR